MRTTPTQEELEIISRYETIVEQLETARWPSLNEDGNKALDKAIQNKLDERATYLRQQGLYWTKYERDIKLSSLGI